VRQFRAEVRERLAEAQRLRDELQRQGFDVSELNQVVRDLQALDNNRVYQDPKGLAQLQASVVDGVKQFEYRLRRELAGAADEKKLLTGSDEVPEGFRKLVEEYYKALSAKKQGGN
jgi:hypothetical protein